MAVDLTLATQVVEGDCLLVMPTLPASSVDAIVSDPPYGLGFMGKQWDHGVPGVPFWREALRVAKPGAHLLAFGGTRTFHRLACAIEDAGWEIRDCLSWLYGQGFPKSHDVSKAIDKANGDWRGRAGVKTRVGQPAKGDEYERTPKGPPIAAAAAEWNGWGTALKPAWEPVILARKPLSGTVAENAQEHRTGALNIDGCRIAGTKPLLHAIDSDARQNPILHTRSATSNGEMTDVGRWPANVVLDEAAAGMLDEQSGEAGGGWGYSGKHTASGGLQANGWGTRNTGERVGFEDSGGASRFFYTAKASRSEREAGLAGFDAVGGCEVTGREPGSAGAEASAYAGTSQAERANIHPTVKPVDLMRWLVRLVTPIGGLVLDPFTGSGTTGIAAHLEGCRFIGIEKEAQYARIARARIKSEADQALLPFGAP